MRSMAAGGDAQRDERRALSAPAAANRRAGRYLALLRLSTHLNRSTSMSDRTSARGRALARPRATSPRFGPAVPNLRENPRHRAHKRRPTRCSGGIRRKLAPTQQRAPALSARWRLADTSLRFALGRVSLRAFVRQHARNSAYAVEHAGRGVSDDVRGHARRRCSLAAEPRGVGRRRAASAR